MPRWNCLSVLGPVVMLTACAGAEPSGPGSDARTTLAASVAPGGVASTTGSGHHTRIVGTEEDLTTFAWSALRHADGITTGQYQYNFRARGFAIHGPVTCVSVRGNEAWIGGVVERINTDDPTLLFLEGVDMWWRVRDNGEGASSAPDLATGVGFAFPGSTITAESWCRDQPALLPLRVVENGNLQVRG